MQQAEILPADMKVLMNHIYELKKGGGLLGTYTR